jgi:hypothetical protein
MLDVEMRVYKGDGVWAPLIRKGTCQQCGHCCGDPPSGVNIIVVGEVIDDFWGDLDVAKFKVLPGDVCFSYKVDSADSLREVATFVSEEDADKYVALIKEMEKSLGVRERIAMRVERQIVRVDLKGIITPTCPMLLIDDDGTRVCAQGSGRFVLTGHKGFDHLVKFDMSKPILCQLSPIHPVWAEAIGCIGYTFVEE